MAPSRGFSPWQVERLLDEVLVIHARTDDCLLGRGRDTQEQPP
jgi:hypothetical protein